MYGPSVSSRSRITIFGPKLFDDHSKNLSYPPSRSSFLFLSIQRYVANRQYFVHAEWMKAGSEQHNRSLQSPVAPNHQLFLPTPTSKFPGDVAGTDQAPWRLRGCPQRQISSATLAFLLFHRLLLLPKIRQLPEPSSARILQLFLIRSVLPLLRRLRL